MLTYLKLVFRFTISILLWLVTIPLLTVCILYRCLIHWILKWKMGDQYCGLLDKADAIFAVKNHKPPMIMTLIILESGTKKDIIDEVRKSFNEKIFSVPSNYPKLTQSVRSYGGYSYFVKGNITFDDVFKEIPQPEDKFDMRYMEEYIVASYQRDLPFEDEMTTLWDIHISKNPFDDKEHNCRYPILIRLNHVVCDGTSFSELLHQVLGGTSGKIYSKEIYKNSYERKSVTLFWFTTIFLNFADILLGNISRSHDDNDLHPLELTGEKVMASVFETKSECFPMIRQIKRHISDARVSSILATAASASLTQYFKRNKLPIPSQISGCLPLVLDYPVQDDNKLVTLLNKSTACIFEVPSIIRGSLLDNLRQMSDSMRRDVTIESAMMYKLIVCSLIGYIPYGLHCYVLGLQAPTFLLTSIPGGSRSCLLNDCTMRYAVPVANIFGRMGVSIGIYTYDDRIHVGVVVDRGVIDSYTEVKLIADDILAAIREMYNLTKDKI